MRQQQPVKTIHQQRIDYQLVLVNNALADIKSENVERVYAKYRGKIIGDSRRSKKTVEQIKDDLFKTAQICGRKLVMTFVMKDRSCWVLRGNGVLYKSTKNVKEAG